MDGWKMARLCGEGTNLSTRWIHGRLECGPLNPHPPCCLFCQIVARIHNVLQFDAHPPPMAAPSHEFSSHAVNNLNHPYCSRLLRELPLEEGDDGTNKNMQTPWHVCLDSYLVLVVLNVVLVATLSVITVLLKIWQILVARERQKTAVVCIGTWHNGADVLDFTTASC